MKDESVEDKKSFSEHLRIGDHDSWVLLGSEAQQELREFSKQLSVLLMNSSGDLEYLIHDLICEIDDFQQVVSERKVLHFLQSESARRDRAIKKYNAILVCIDKMDLALKLQEAQLIKDSKIIEKLGKINEHCFLNLELAISYGKSILEKKPLTLMDEDIENWYLRLSKRLEDLEISHTVSIQCKAQLKIMLENNTHLIDKILVATAGTIPIWRNQVTMLLDIEKINKNLEVQSKVAEATRFYLNKNNVHSIKKKKEGKEIDVEKILKANEKLKQSLDELVDEENKDSNIRLELNSFLM